MSSPLAPTELSIERLTTAERVAEALREQLLSGVFAPGAPMRDVELSVRAGVSRTTMREALSQLAREGLLTHSLHRGMEVSRLAPADVRDIYAARRVLELRGAEGLMANRLLDREDLERSLAAMTDAVRRDDRRRVVEADMAFHTAIVAATGSRRLVSAMTSSLMELRLVLSVTDRTYDDLDEQLRQHRALLDGIHCELPTLVASLDAHLVDAQNLVCAVLEDDVVALTDRT